MAEQQSNTASDSSRLIVDDAFEVAPVNDRLFGSFVEHLGCLLYTSPSPRDRTRSRMPSSA